MASYFIKIEDGPDLRRKLLESSKASLHVLKIYQQLVITRGQKLSLIANLRRELKEITLLLNQAEALMPVLSDKELEEMMPKKQVVAKLQKPSGIIVIPKMKMDIPPKPKEPSVYVGPPMRKIIADVSVPRPELTAPAREEVPRPRMTELEKLEAQLAAVEGKLGNM